MDSVTNLLRTKTWAAIGLTTAVTLGLAAMRQMQLATFTACVLGCLMMWKSENDNPSAPVPDLDED